MYILSRAYNLNSTLLHKLGQNTVNFLGHNNDRFKGQFTQARLSFLLFAFLIIILYAIEGLNFMTC